MEYVARPQALRVPVPSVTPPSLKVTVPVGMPKPDVPGNAKAVNVTRWPYTDGLADEKTKVTVFTFWTLAKVAVIALLPSIMMLVGLVLPLRSPLHPVNSQPGSAVAVMVTTVPYV